MACLGDLYKLVSIENDNAYIGCSGEKNDENVILTLADYIIVYNVEHKRTVHLWKSKRGEHFTSPAIYCDNSHEYVVVINSKIIKTFQDDFAKGKRFTVSTFIHKIFYHKNSNKSYVIFEDSTVSPLESVLQNPKLTAEFTTKPLLSSELLADCLYIISNKDNVLSMTVSNVAGTSSKTLKLENDGNVLLGSCFSSAKKNLVTLWSNGSVCISGDISQQSDGVVSLQQVKKLPAITEKMSGKRLLAALADDIVAVVHSSPTQKDELCISAVDLLYGSVYTCHKSNTTDTNAQVDMFDGRLLMIANKEICEVTYSAEPVTLFSVAHCQQKASSDADLHADNFYLQAEPEQRKMLENLMNFTKSSNNNAAKMEVWGKLWESLAEVKRMDLFSSRYMGLLIKQLLKEKNFQLITSIIKTGHLTTRVSPYLLDGVIEMGDECTDLMMDYLNNINDVSESDMVKCLDHLFSDKDVVTAKQEKILNKIISLPNTDNEVKEALTRLSYNKSEALLKFLCTGLENSEILQEDETMYKQAIGWVSNVIDVNYANFIAYENSIEILVKLQQVVSLQSEYMEEFRKIGVFMMVMENSQKLKRSRPQDFSYKIQLMTI